jgi:hypothetical protein
MAEAMIPVFSECQAFQKALNAIHAEMALAGQREK